MILGQNYRADLGMEVRRGMGEFNKELSEQLPSICSGRTQLPGAT